jgi:hypothetical protein
VTAAPSRRDAGTGPPAFDRVVVIGSTDLEGVVPARIGVDRLEESQLPPGSRVSVETLLRLGRECRSARERALILTERDLVAPECDSLIGFAESKANLAIVSAFHLRRGCDPERFRRRLRNAIAHELGHLRGLRHCHRPGCLMNPAVVAADLDQRDDEACGRCPTRGWTRARFGWPPTS